MCLILCFAYFQSAFSPLITTSRFMHGRHHPHSQPCPLRGFKKTTRRNGSQLALCQKRSKPWKERSDSVNKTSMGRQNNQMRTQEQARGWSILRRSWEMGDHGEKASRRPQNSFTNTIYCVNNSSCWVGQVFHQTAYWPLPPARNFPIKKILCPSGWHVLFTPSMKLPTVDTELLTAVGTETLFSGN